MSCRQIVEDMVPHMAHAFAALISLTDIGHIVLLGAYAEGGTYLTDLLQQEISRRLPKVTGVQLSIRTGNRLTKEDLVVSAATPAIQIHLGVQVPTTHLG